VACVIRMAVGILVIVMTISFEPLVNWLAVTAAVTSIGWSLLMALALHSHLDAGDLAKLATGSHWFDVVLALTIFAIFLPDPVATPVAALPLLVFRLATRYGRPGAWGGAALFVGLIGLRIVVNRVFNGEGLVRPPLLLAWALVATLVIVLALEIESHSRTEEAAGDEEDELLSPGRTDRSPVATASTRDETLDNLAACLASQLEQADQTATLTQREQEVLLLLGQGRSYSSIAGSLFISVGTVRNHVHNIRHKLDIGDREQLLTLAREVAARCVRVGDDAQPTQPDRPAAV
jgi:DNA-binding CsgD family transcriptional regulator